MLLRSTMPGSRPHPLFATAPECAVFAIPELTYVVGTRGVVTYLRYV